MTGERGAATVVMAAVTALLAAATVAAGSLAVVYSARAQAQSAADGAALAAAVATYPGTSRSAPATEAANVAGANGARLISCVCHVDSSLSIRDAGVVVGVHVDVPVFGDLELRAASKAEFDPRRWLGR